MMRGRRFNVPRTGQLPFRKREGGNVFWLIVFIVIVIVVFGLGFVVKALLWVALALFILWLISLIIAMLRRR
jgi:hypothetical protein